MGLDDELLVLNEHVHNELSFARFADAETATEGGSPLEILSGSTIADPTDSYSKLKSDDTTIGTIMDSSSEEVGTIFAEKQLSGHNICIRYAGQAKANVSVRFTVDLYDERVAHQPENQLWDIHRVVLGVPTFTSSALAIFNEFRKGSLESYEIAGVFPLANKREFNPKTNQLFLTFVPKDFEADFNVVAMFNKSKGPEVDPTILYAELETAFTKTTDGHVAVSHTYLVNLLVQAKRPWPSICAFHIEEYLEPTLLQVQTFEGHTSHPVPLKSAWRNNTLLLEVLLDNSQNGAHVLKFGYSVAMNGTSSHYTMPNLKTRVSPENPWKTSVKVTNLTGTCLSISQDGNNAPLSHGFSSPFRKPLIIQQGGKPSLFGGIRNMRNAQVQYDRNSSVATEQASVKVKEAKNTEPVKAPEEDGVSEFSFAHQLLAGCLSLILALVVMYYAAFFTSPYHQLPRGVLQMASIPIQPTGCSYVIPKTTTVTETTTLFATATEGVLQKYF